MRAGYLTRTITGLEKVKQRILEYLAVAKLTGKVTVRLFALRALRV